MGTRTVGIMRIRKALAGILVLFLLPTLAINCNIFETSDDVSCSKMVISYDNETRPFELSYTSNDRLGPTQLEDGAVAWGDRVVLNATFPDIPAEPELNVTKVNYTLTTGFLFEYEGVLTVPAPSYDPSVVAVNDSEFAWVEVEGIIVGDTVNVFLNFTNSDCDLYAWWADTDNTTWTSANNLLGDQMTTETKPETGSFIAAQSGSVTLGIFDYDLTEGNFTLSVDTRIEQIGTNEANHILVDTWLFGRNITASVLFEGVLVNGTVLIREFSSLTLNNFFAPHLSDLEITGDWPLLNISWTVFDLNADDQHFFEIFLSADSGVTFQLLISHYNHTEFQHDFTGFLAQRDYLFKVRVFDNDPILNPMPSIGNYILGLSDEIETEPVRDHDMEPYAPTPSISHLQDISTFNGLSFQIEWEIISDEILLTSPVNYEILKAGVLIESGIWNHGDGPIILEVSGLDVGNHSYTLKMWYDGSTVVQDIVDVQILEASPLSQFIPFILTFSVLTGVGLIILFVLRKSLRSAG